jgi:hypothetical protein
VGLSEKALKNLIGKHVKAIFEAGHGGAARTREIIEGINTHASVVGVTTKDGGRASRDRRIVEGLEMYCEERRRTTAGTYTLPIHAALRAVAVAAGTGSATATDVEQSTGLNRHFVRAAQNGDGGRLRKTRFDKRNVEVARQFWHNSGVSRLDSNASSKSKVLFTYKY